MNSGIGHINIVVQDLDKVADFFVANFGFTAGEPVRLDGKWVEKLTGFPNAAARYVPLIPPEGSSSTKFELLKYIIPPSPTMVTPPALNIPGYRHIGFEVDDIDARAKDLAGQGWNFFSEIVEVPEMNLKTVYFAGPEAIILQMTQKLKSPSNVEKLS